MELQNRYMKNTLTQQCIDKVLELGNSNDPASIPRLIKALDYPDKQVRRFAVSALGKLAKFAENPNEVVSVLIPVLQDNHHQIKQYAIKALSAYGSFAESAIDDLQDIANNLNEKEYNQRDAKLAIERINEAIAIKKEQSIQKCLKCSINISADEYSRSQKAFQRNYCDKCFDEVYLKRRNFDTKVELNKNIKAKDGTLVQSKGEKIISEYLSSNYISFRYDERIRIIEGMAIRPDFYLPEFDIYIEYWGMDTIDYKIGMLKKQQLYQQEGKKLISLYFSDFYNLTEILRNKLSRYIKI